jgi:1-acyl-sn-glycerol-3-phosphate acyltransferase
MDALISIAIWIGCTSLLAVLWVAMLITIVIFPFDHNRKIAHAQCFWWSDAIIAMNPKWRVRVVGLENISPKQTYVLVVNHQSMADIVVLYQTRMQFKWVAKESLFKVPFLGWCLSLSKHIKITRGNLGSIKKVYREAIEWLRKDISVAFFPEGTRSETGELGDFQNGAFKLAIQEKRPVLPVSIKGNTNAIPKGSWIFSSEVSCTLTVFPPVETAHLRPGEFRELRDTVRSKLL